MIMEDKCCLNYEAEHARACAERDKAMSEAKYLRDELRMKEEEMKWLCGFRSAVELIFGGKNND